MDHLNKRRRINNNDVNDDEKHKKPKYSSNNNNDMNNNNNSRSYILDVPVDIFKNHIFGYFSIDEFKSIRLVCSYFNKIISDIWIPFFDFDILYKIKNSNISLAYPFDKDIKAIVYKDDNSSKDIGDIDIFFNFILQFKNLKYVEFELKKYLSKTMYLPSSYIYNMKLELTTNEFLSLNITNNVRCLKLHDALNIGGDIIKNFPDSLTELHIDRSGFISDSIMSYFSTGLQKLKLYDCHSITNKGLLSLSSSITDLSLYNCSEIVFDKIFPFSHNLCKLRLHSGLKEVKNSGLDGFSTKLKYLKVHNCNSIVGKTILDLPNSIEKLYLSNVNLVSFLSCDDFTFPKKIETLYLEFYPHKSNYVQKFDLWFPNGIKNIHLFPRANLNGHPITFHFKEIGCSLNSLELYNLKFTKGLLEHIPNTLEKLILRECQIVYKKNHDNTILRDQNGNFMQQNLLYPKNLKELTLSFICGLTDDDLCDLSKKNQLYVLDIFCALHITNDGLKYLPKTLKKLCLNECDRITDNGLNNLPENIEILELTKMNGITDNGMKSFLPKKLIKLSLTNIKITINGLKGIPNTLGQLELNNTITLVISKNKNNLDTFIQKIEKMLSKKIILKSIKYDYHNIYYLFPLLSKQQQQ